MKKNSLVTSIMTRDIKTIHHGQKLSEARQMLSEGSFHHIPVVSGKKLIGMLSATDMMRLSFEQYGANEQMNDVLLDQQFSIEQVMSEDVVTLTNKSTIRNAVEVLSEGSFHSLPIVDSDGNLEGIVTSTDLLRFLLSQY